MATADEQLNEQLAGAVALSAQIDRQQLSEKTRVYVLAKQLGISSKLLLAQLSTLGVSKKAQSTLSIDEVTRLLDSLQNTQPKAPTTKAAKKSTKSVKKSTKTAAKAAKKKTSSAPIAETPQVISEPEASAVNADALEADAVEADALEAEALDGVADQGEAEASATQKLEETPKKKSRKRAVRTGARTQTKKVEDQPDTTQDAQLAGQSDAQPDTQQDTQQDAVSDEPKETTEVAAGEEITTPTRKRSRTRRVVKRTSESTVNKASNSDSDDAADSVDEESGQSDKLRYRVQKNVENEIHQIEGKVESELAAVALEALSDNHNDDEHVHADLGDEDIESTSAEEDKSVADDDVLAAYAPIFMPPKPVTPSPAAALASADAEEFEDEERGHDEDSSDATSTRRRRGRRGTSRGRGKEANADSAQDKNNDVEIIDEPRGIKGSTRIESQRRRRAEMRSKDRESRHVVTQAEFLARREAVERTMVVRERERHDGHGNITQVGVLEDGMLVEHFVTDETNTSTIGNIYLGRVQNVLPSMEAAFIDIGTGRNGVLYAGEVNWRQAGLGGRARKIEQAMKSGDQVLVQVAKDPVGHKGPRLTTQISLPGRFLVYVPGGRNAGISRKLPAPERKRLREILEKVVPDQGGAIIRTAAENVAEEAIAADVNRLHDTWNEIQQAAEKAKSSKGTEPVALYEEPQMLVKVIRDLFNEDFDRLVVDGARPYEIVSSYVNRLAPELADRVSQYSRADNAGIDAFETYRVDEQLQKALSRKVWLPSGGTLVIDRTEAMTVVDVNTGKFTGTGGNLEETVTKNNLEAAEEIVRQMRLRDLGGMIVVDFIDMVLPENQELVLRRLKEALGRDRTRHQVSEVTSLGLVQMTRKRLGSGLLETFSTECETCQGRGLILHEDPVEEGPIEAHDPHHGAHGEHRRGYKKHRDKHEQGRDRGVLRQEVEDNQQEAETPSDVPSQGGAERDSNNGRARRGARRRGASKSGPASRGVSKGANKRSDDSNLDDLIAGIVVDTSAAESKPRESDAHGASVTDIESIAYAASDRAEALDDVGEFSSYVAEGTGGKTYAEALKEFEESPRRKRQTRGNSRSDYPPRREDFESPEAATIEDEQPAVGMEIKKDTKRRRVRASNRKPREVSQAKEQDASTPQVELADAGTEPAQRKDSERGAKKRAQVEAVTRGRRRAVRRGSQTRNLAQESVATKQSRRSQDSPAHEGEPQVQRKRTDGGVEVTTVRRGRKRAVRRVAVRPSGEGQKSANSVAQEPKATTRKAQRAEQSNKQKTRGRTRRRVTRRGSN